MTCIEKYHVWYSVVAISLDFNPGHFLEGFTAFQEKIPKLSEEIPHFLFKWLLRVSERRRTPVSSE